MGIWTTEPWPKPYQLLGTFNYDAETNLSSDSDSGTTHTHFTNFLDADLQYSNLIRSLKYLAAGLRQEAPTCCSCIPHAGLLFIGGTDG